jgi:hypothetical protein
LIPASRAAWKRRAVDNPASSALSPVRGLVCRTRSTVPSSGSGCGPDGNPAGPPGIGTVVLIVIIVIIVLALRR